MLSQFPVKAALPSRSKASPFDRLFLTSTEESLAAYREAIATATSLLVESMATQHQPYSGCSPVELAAGLSSVNLCPEVGQDLAAVLKQVERSIVRHSVNVSHPTCIAHLHCPPLTAALAAELLISATNQSMDSWDQSPAATLVEQRMVDWLCRLFGYTASADGTFTSGGTQSNFMGLLLARDRYLGKHFDWDVQQQGLPPQASRLRILCSTFSHFTVRQSAALLGLGHQAVVTVESDETYRMRARDVERQLVELKQQDLLPIAIVATAGTTDFGSIDALPELAICAQAQNLWLHVDAAFGGALMLSDRHRSQLSGIEAADSITVDFHKLFYQPISCGAFLLKERSNFNSLELHAAYLNPESNADLGIPDLVTKSIQTTRRFDALKLYISLQTLGRQLFAQTIDTTIELAEATARLIAADPVLELAVHPTINAVVFRYCSTRCPADVDRVNSQIRLSLLHQGKAVIAQTSIGNHTYLKFTLLNPRTTLAHIEALLDDIKQLGRQLESERSVEPT